MFWAKVFSSLMGRFTKLPVTAPFSTRRKSNHSAPSSSLFSMLKFRRMLAARLPSLVTVSSLASETPGSQLFSDRMGAGFCSRSRGVPKPKGAPPFSPGTV